MRNLKDYGDVFSEGKYYQARVYEINRGNLLAKGNLRYTKEEAASDARQLRMSKEVRELIRLNEEKRLEDYKKVKSKRVKRIQPFRLPNKHEEAYKDVIEIEANIYGCTHIYNDFFRFNFKEMKIPRSFEGEGRNSEENDFSGLLYLGGGKHSVSYWYKGKRYISNMLETKQALWALRFVKQYLEGTINNGDTIGEDSALSRMD